MPLHYISGQWVTDYTAGHYRRRDVVASNRILGADGQPATVAERKTIPVVGGPLDGLMLIQKSDHLPMAIYVQPTGEGDRDLWLQHKYRDGTWRFVGWMDKTKRVIAVEGSHECHLNNEDRAVAIKELRRKFSETTKQVGTPLEFEGMS